MRHLTMANSVSIQAFVHLLEFARAINFDWDRLSIVVARLERMTYIDEVEDGHQFWIKLDLETSNGVTAERRIKNVLAKVERLLRRYTRKV